MSVLNSAIDDATMQKLNYEVVEKGRDRAEVARTFLWSGFGKAEDFKTKIFLTALALIEAPLSFSTG